MPGKTLAVVIPAKNEEFTIGEVIDRIEEEVSGSFSEIKFVIPSSSTDSTDEIAEEKGAEVIRDGGTGLGEAMFRGLKKSLEFDPDLILSIDADLQFRPSEVHKLIDASEDADLVLGSRFLEPDFKYDMSLIHRLGNRVLTKMTNHVTGLSLTDAQTGYRAMKPEVVEELRMVGRHTYVQETVMDAHSNGFEIEEVPVAFHEREEGGSRVVSSISRYALRTLPVILHRAGYTPYLLNGTGILMGSAGFLVFLWGLIRSGYPTAVGGAIISLLALQMFFLGMLLDAEFPRKH